MNIRKKNLEKVIQQCQKTLDRIEEELSKPEQKLTPYDIKRKLLLAHSVQEMQ